MAEVRQEKFLTAEQVGLKFGLSGSTVYRLAKEGYIPCLRLGSSVRFPESELDAYIYRTIKCPDQTVAFKDRRINGERRNGERRVVRP